MSTPQILDPSLDEGRIVPISDRDLAMMVQTSEVEQMLKVAREYPRSVTKFNQQATEMITASPAIALNCFYDLPPRKQWDPVAKEYVKKPVMGPNVRFAEILAATWQNCRTAAKNAGEEGECVKAVGMFFCLQNNFSKAIEVAKRITDSNGQRYTTDMVVMTMNAAVSTASRNAILQAIPKAVWQPLYVLARQTAAGDIRTLPARRDNAIATFKEMGVSPEELYALLNIKGLDDLGIDQMITLQSILKQLENKETTLDEIFRQAMEEPIQVQQPNIRLQVRSNERLKAAMPAPVAEKPAPPKVVSYSTAKTLSELTQQKKVDEAETLEKQILEAQSKLEKLRREKEPDPPKPEPATHNSAAASPAASVPPSTSVASSNGEEQQPLTPMYWDDLGKDSKEHTPRTRGRR